MNLLVRYLRPYFGRMCGGMVIKFIGTIMDLLLPWCLAHIVDDVIPALRASLRARFVRSKNTAQVRAAIRSQVMVELENKRAQEIIDSFGEVSVKASEDDPTVCLVEFSFAVAHGLNRIYLSAHITV